MAVGSKLTPFPARRRQAQRNGLSVARQGRIDAAVPRQLLGLQMLEEGGPACILDQAGEVLFANRAFDHIKRALAAADRLPRPLVDGEGPSETRLKVQRNGRTEVYRCLKRPLEDPQGPEGPELTALIYHSVPEAQQLAEALAAIKVRLDDITRLVSDWVWEIDRDGQFTFVSARIDLALGFHPLELMGKGFAVLIEEVPATLGGATEQGHRSPFRDLEVAMRHKDGSERTFKLSGLPIYDSLDGRFLGLRGTAADVTELRHREAALIQAKEAAELANRAKTEFLANMSHELRTPLNAVIGFAEVMEQEILGPLGNEQYLSYATDINGSAQHLLKVINDILDIAKIEAGGHDLQEEELHPAHIVQSVVRLISDRVKRAKQKLEVSLPEDLPPLYADERKIKQVLINLLSNANKFTPEGGKIEVKVCLSAEGEMEFRVVDNGIGILAENMERVFEPFEQVDSRLARQYEGTGLGLPLSRGFMRLHGGDLLLESEPDVGTLAIARLPADRVG